MEIYEIMGAQHTKPLSPFKQMNQLLKNNYLISYYVSGTASFNSILDGSRSECYGMCEYATQFYEKEIDWFV